MQLRTGKTDRRGAVAGVRFPHPQRITCADDLNRIQFVEDMAEIEVPIEHLDVLPLKNEDRCDSRRLYEVERAIRDQGYDNLEPVVVRLGRRGRWVIVDGGHRVTAARKVSKEFFTNLFGPKVRSIYFLLFRTPLSNSRDQVGDDHTLLADAESAGQTAPRRDN